MDIKNKSVSLQTVIALLFFIVSALYGLLMRWQIVSSIFSVKYVNVLQAHSHVTFLGWGFLSVIAFITASFIPKNEGNIYKLRYKYPFWIMVFSLVGMLLSFPLQGYKLFSILFLTVFLLASYMYLFSLYKQVNPIKSYSTRFIKSAIIYYYISSLGIWALSIITAKIGKGDWYQHAISFYTHFLYNGFFVLSLFGLLLRYFEINSIKLSKAYSKYFYLTTNFAVIPTFALSLLWVSVPVYVIVLGFIGAITQLISLYFLWKIIQEIFSITFKNKLLNTFLLKIIIISYVLKIVFQFFGAFPSITRVALDYKSYFVIGYIHLFTLGFMSLFILVLNQLFLKRIISKWGAYLLVLGIVLSETLLFTQGVLFFLQEKTISNYTMLLLMATILMPLGLLIILIKLIPFWLSSSHD